MSTLSNIFGDLCSFLYGARCAVCGKGLEDCEDYVCLECRLKMPETKFHLDYDNPMAERVRSLSPRVEGVAAMFYYIHNSRWRSTVHAIKYYSMWYVARYLGHWYGSQLASSPHFADIDYVVPVPLHWRRRLSRRYNQSEMLAAGIASALGVKLSAHAITRRRNNPSQVTRSSRERWNNVDDLFVVRHPSKLAGRHVLIVDDVFTTGATITACIDAIERSAPTCRISVVTLAVARHHINGYF